MNSNARLVQRLAHRRRGGLQGTSSFGGDQGQRLGADELQGHGASHRYRVVHRDGHPVEQGAVVRAEDQSRLDEQIRGGAR